MSGTLQQDSVQILLCVQFVLLVMTHSFEGELMVIGILSAGILRDWF